MLIYLRNLIQQAWGYLELSVILSPFWYLFTQEAHNFIFSRAVVILTLLWFATLVAKNIVMYLDPRKKICFESNIRSCGTLLVWFVWLGTAYLFRYFGAGLVAYPMELASLLIQGGALLKFTCMCSSNPFIQAVGENFETTMQTRVNDTFKPIHIGLDTLDHLNKSKNQADLKSYPSAGYSSSQFEFIHCPRANRPDNCPFKLGSNVSIHEDNKNESTA